MLVEKIIQDFPEKSIGVVTFNIQQQQYITECLEDRFIQAEQSIPDDLIVKNIENVQGDEKDIIIFSVGYAPDKDGKMSMKFGSLNAVGGENRLNVAITRAREHIYVITSILPGDLKIGKTKNKGPKLLKEYLQYAKEISDGQPILPEPRPADFAESWYLKERIKSGSSDNRSYELQEHLPFADLVMQTNDQYLGLILTDDDQYHQSISVKDSHVYVPMVLQKKGWRFLKIFSREYWMSPVEVEEQIGKFAVKES